MIFKRRYLIYSSLLMILILSGCSTKYKYQEPSKTLPQAKVVAMVDKEHKINVFGNSSICILGVDGKSTKSFWSGKYVSPKIREGARTLYVEEDLIYAEFIYISYIKFTAKAGEEYVVSSKHTYDGKKIIDVEFLLLNHGKIIGTFKAEKVRRGNNIYVPIMI